MPDTLIMVSADKIFRLNIQQETISTFYDFNIDFSEQPEFFIFNEDQTVCIIASEEDALMINIDTKEEIDLDKNFGISLIEKVIFHNDDFFIMCNKRDGKFGFFLLRLPEYNPLDHTSDIEEHFLINWNNRLKISDADIYVIEDKK